MKLRVLVAVMVLAGVMPASAQQSVKVEFSAGRVSVSAQNAPVRVILAEWARLGGATIVNAERLAGAPVTLELANVTERQALDTLLRGAAGYMLAPRRTGTQGVSAFDRILILPTSAAPRPAPAPPAQAGGAAPRPLVLPRPPVVLDQPEPGPDDDPVPETPEPEPPRPAQPITAPRPLIPQVVRPAQPAVPNGGDQPPAAEQPAGTNPGNPFGMPAGSSPLPGVISVPTPRTPPVQGGNQGR